MEKSLFIKYMKETKPTVDNSNLTELKNCLDDATKRLLSTDLGFKENHYIINMKLFLGYLSVISAGAGSGYSYLKGFHNTKEVLLISVVSYFILQSILYLFQFFCEGEKIFVGTDEQNKKVVVTSKVEKYSPIYNLSFSFENNKQKKVSAKFSKSMAHYFDIKGKFAYDPFYSDMTAFIKKH